MTSKVIILIVLIVTLSSFYFIKNDSLKTHVVIADNPLKRPFNEVRGKYSELLMKGKFQLLDAEAKLARKNSSTLADGQPRLAAFYLGVSGQNIKNEDREKFLQQLKKWSQSNPSSLSAKIANASYYIQYAWAIRGAGYKVKNGGREAFHEYMEKAKVELMKLDENNKSIPTWYTPLLEVLKIDSNIDIRIDPGWYGSMLKVARSQGWDYSIFDTLYLEGVKKFPEYLPLYFEKAQYLAPRWYGSISELSTYIKNVTEETKPILGYTLYARLNWLVSTTDMFDNGQANWNEMKKGFETIIQDYPHAWIINNYGKFSCEARDWDTLYSLKNKIQLHPLNAAWYKSSKFRNDCIYFAKRFASQNNTTK
jgi:uncharacterized protein DUF4034